MHICKFENSIYRKILACCDNDCGKTTLVRLLTDGIYADKGIIYIAHQISILMIKQLERLNVNSTVKENEDISINDVILQQLKSCGELLYKNK